ncbi:hypothetical protein GW17_00061390, partial [Ensete ventricosum]
VTFNAAGMFSQAKSTRSLGESKCPSLKRRLPYKSSFPDQVGMASSISFTTSEFTSRSSSDPSSQAEGCRPSNRVGSRLEALSSSSVILTRSDVKAIKAVEVMKSCHDFDSTISTESLVLIRRRFSIPDEYALHAPQPGQHSYHENGEPQDDTQRDEAQRATEIFLEVRVETIAQKAPEASGKRSAEVTSHPRKKVKTFDCHRSRHTKGGSKPHSSKGKEQVGAAREIQTPCP